MVSLSDLAAEFLRARRDAKRFQPKQLRTFITARLADPYNESLALRTRDEDQVLALKDDRPRGRARA